MFSETCLKYKLYRSLLQPLPILEPSPKTFQSNLWLRIAQSEQQIFIKQDQDQHTASTPEGRAALPPPKTTCGPRLARHPRQPVAPPPASGQPRYYTATSDNNYIQDFITQAFSLTGQTVFIHRI